MRGALQIAAAAVLLAPWLQAEIVDRVAANIELRAITDSEVRDQIRVAAFIDEAEPDFSAENLRNALDRIIDQTLMRDEMEFVRFQGPSAEEVAPLVQQVKARFSNDTAYQAALRKYGITEEQLAEQVTWQLAMLRFIEFRFQPAVEVTNTLMRQEYRQQAQLWKEKHGTEAPPLEEIRDDIEKIVRQRLIDSALDRWLGEVRTQNTILYHEGYQ
jgi:hypothetical protein